MTDQDKQKQLASILNRPLDLGKNRTLYPRIVLAPMTVLGNVAFRAVVEHFGGSGLMFSEMCSAKRIPHENPVKSNYFKWRETEKSRLVWQIYGNDEFQMAQAAKIIEDRGFFGVDINFGCCVNNICAQGGGAALLKTPVQAERIVRTVRKSVSIPVFVKFRTGWTDRPEPAMDLARRFEDAGADLLTFHPRVAPDRRTRPPRWEYIAHLVSTVSIPVLGNGNLFSSADALAMLNNTGCHGLSVGRMAVTRPWIFAQWTKGRVPDNEEWGRIPILLARYLARWFDPKPAYMRFVRFMEFFSANFRFGHSLHLKVRASGDLNSALAVVRAFMDGDAQRLKSPALARFV